MNAVRGEFADGKDGILAVNGPPGTGKTTLLRDLVAHYVSSRAAAMIKFDDPEQAFKASGQKLSVGNGAFLHLYKLDPTLKGFELLVASSNNKAVENVSKELPAGKSVEPGPQYFRSVAQMVCGSGKGDGSDAEHAENEDTPWGLISVALGRGKNIAAFQKSFWWDKDRGLLTYLRAARGDDVRVDRPVTEEQPAHKEIPAVVAAERPLSGPAAVQHWKKVRGQFKRLQSQIESRLAELEMARALPGKVVKAHAVLAQEQRLLEKTKDVHAVAQRRHEDDEQEARASKEGCGHAALSLQALLAGKPGLFARLFRTQVFRRWDQERIKTSDEHAKALLRAATAQSAVTASFERLKEATQAQAAASKRTSSAQAVLDKLQVQLDQAHEQIGDRFVDEAFFAKGHESWNLASPWLGRALHRLREQLFTLGLEVHSAFVTVAAQKMQHNLGALMNAMQVGAFDVAEKRALLPDLWSTLFLVIPVVSTTFASVDRMLGDVAEGAFGWLLVDEAGQATPQATVGALMRAKRIVVVGDPLQIPPVVTIPSKLISQIAKHFEVERNTWCAPEASVQTLSDTATHIRAQFTAGVGVREVGMPLLVHRRCQDPMFSVCNVIAYDNQMVYAAGKDRTGPIGKALGESSWLHVSGTATSKWSAQEGQAVLHLLRTLARSGVRNPDVYLISPFRVVAHEMRQLLRSAPELFVAFGVQEYRFLEERVGTIHTFQGKEAEAVIAVLGAPLDNQRGARQWAASTPNILNVMVSRAKSRLYVVSSHDAWGGVGHFAELARRLHRKVL